MPDKSVVRARIDERTKREAAAALKKIGLTVSDAFRLLLVRVAAEKQRKVAWGQVAIKLFWEDGYLTMVEITDVTTIKDVSVTGGSSP